MDRTIFKHNLAKRNPVKLGNTYRIIDMLYFKDQVQKLPFKSVKT